MPYAEQREALQRAQLDLGMGMVPIDDPGLDGRAFTRARPVVAVPSADELAALAVVPWENLQGRDAVVLDPEQAGNARAWIDGILAEHGVQIHESQSVADTESAISFASFGFGLAIVFAAAGTLPERPGVTFVELPPDAGDLELGAIWRRDDENPLREKFVETLAACAMEVAPLASPLR
jgi:DNA-binding transcriptional LysR family regulator